MLVGASHHPGLQDCSQALSSKKSLQGSFCKVHAGVQIRAAPALELLCSSRAAAAESFAALGSPVRQRPGAGRQVQDGQVRLQLTSLNR